MRKGLVLCLVVGLVFGLSTLVLAGIDGSHHDFINGVGYIYDANVKQLCIACHVPHASLTKSGSWSPSKAILWAQGTTISGVTNWWTSGDFWYTNFSVSGRFAANTPAFDGSTKRCMSCHDGSLFLNTGAWETDARTFATSAKITDLTTVHPVAVEYYNSANELPNEFNSVAVAIGAGKTRLYDANGNKIVDSGASAAWVGCGSCHDPHNSVSYSGIRKFARPSIINSELCTACHKK